MRNRHAPGFRDRLWVGATALLLAAAGLAAAQDGDSSVSIIPRARAEAKRSAPSDLRVDVKLVLVPVTVTDALGKPVAGLPREAFRVFEDGVEQRIAHFMSEDAPISLGIVFDGSGSMENKIDKSREAVASLLRWSIPGDEYLLITFSDSPRLLAAFTADRAELEAGLTFIRPRGWTALLDAIYLAVNQMKGARNARKALLVLSDGGDNNSRFTGAEIRSLLRESDVCVYAIGMLGGGVTKRSMKLLSGIAEDTGGRMFPVSKLSELPDAVANISAALRGQYVLGYRPANAERDGKYRRVRVRINQPANLPPLRVSWRTGYYAPY